MVALGVKDHHGVIETHQLLADQSGQVGLAVPGSATHRDVELRGGQRHRLAELVRT